MRVMPWFVIAFGLRSVEDVLLEFEKNQLSERLTLGTWGTKLNESWSGLITIWAKPVGPNPHFLIWSSELHDFKAFDGNWLDCTYFVLGQRLERSSLTFFTSECKSPKMHNERKQIWIICLLEWIIQKIELEAESPPQIKWRVGMLELAQSDA
jgi:hypothetical protein